MKIEVGGLNVIGSGTVVVQDGDQVVFHPFDDDEEFIVKVIVIFGSYGEKSVKLSVRSESECAVVFTAPFQDRELLSYGKPLVFAEDDDADYFANISVYVSGTEEKYTMTIHYTFLTRPRG